MNCIFCEIAAHHASAEILFESENVISFLDINPVNYGHALVIPKNHYEVFADVPQHEFDELMYAVQKIFEAVKISLNADGINIVSNNGRAAGQSVFHFHFHIIPRFDNDNFKINLNLKRYQNGLMKEFADKIRSKIIS